MKHIRQYIRNIGIDGWVFGLSGLAAIILSVLNVLGIWPFNTQTTLQILVAAIGALMLAVVTQTTQRTREIEEIKDAIGIADIEAITDGKEFGHYLYRNALKAKRFVSNSLLNSSTPVLSLGYGFTGSQTEFHELLYRRVIKGEIVFRHVVIIYHEQMLKDVIFKLLLHEGYKFIIRHYEPPPTPAPVLNIVSFDDEIFYLGGFPSSGTKRRISVKHIHFADMLQYYWQAHWDRAIPLNEGGIINWEELRRIGLRFGVNQEKFNELVLTVRNDVQNIKRKLPKK